MVEDDFQNPLTDFDWT